MIAGILVAVVAAMTLTGCEQGDGTTALTVDPVEVNLTTATGTNRTSITFTVIEGLRDLSLPLEWKVSNPYLGNIAWASGTTATYAPASLTGSNLGVNVITVKDQYGAQGQASVIQ